MELLEFVYVEYLAHLSNIDIVIAAAKRRKDGGALVLIVISNKELQIAGMHSMIHFSPIHGILAPAPIVAQRFPEPALTIKNRRS